MMAKLVHVSYFLTKYLLIIKNIKFEVKWSCSGSQSLQYISFIKYKIILIVDLSLYEF